MARSAYQTTTMLGFMADWCSSLLQARQQMVAALYDSSIVSATLMDRSSFVTVLQERWQYVQSSSGASVTFAVGLPSSNILINGDFIAGQNPASLTATDLLAFFQAAGIVTPNVTVARYTTAQAEQNYNRWLNDSATVSAAAAGQRFNQRKADVASSEDYFLQSSLSSRLMVNSWQFDADAAFSRYYAACQPSVCSYVTEQKGVGAHVLASLLLGVIGGLDVALKAFLTATGKWIKC